MLELSGQFEFHESVSSADYKTVCATESRENDLCYHHNIFSYRCTVFTSDKSVLIKCMEAEY